MVRPAFGSHFAVRHVVACSQMCALARCVSSSCAVTVKSEEDVAKHGAKAKALFTSKVHSKTLNTKWDFEAGADKQTVDVRLPLASNAHFLLCELLVLRCRVLV
jgi:hypothetical protein